jgi:hypothetical protein
VPPLVANAPDADNDDDSEFAPDADNDDDSEIAPDADNDDDSEIAPDVPVARSLSAQLAAISSGAEMAPRTKVSWSLSTTTNNRIELELLVQNNKMHISVFSH